MTLDAARNFSSAIGDNGSSALSDNYTAVYCQLTARECVNMINKQWVFVTTNELFARKKGQQYN